MLKNNIINNKKSYIHSILKSTQTRMATAIPSVNIYILTYIQTLEFIYT